MYSPFRIEAGLVLSRVKKAQHWFYFIDGVPDLPMNRRESLELLLRLGVLVEDIAMMDLEFRDNPSATLAHFGMLGGFICVE